MGKKKDKLHKLLIGKQRQSQIQSGFFDGRFVQRSESSKKVYSRKSKYRPIYTD